MISDKSLSGWLRRPLSVNVWRRMRWPPSDFETT